MLNKYLGTLLLFILCITGNGQELFTCRLVDKLTGDPIKYANINHNDISIQSNILGYFQYQGLTGDILSISHISYELVDVKIPLNTNFSVSLNPFYYDLGFVNLDSSASYKTIENEQIVHKYESSDILARPIEGYFSFYKLIYDSLFNKSVVQKESFLDLIFSVNSNGVVDNVFTINDSIQAPTHLVKLIKNSNWMPGRQDAYNVKQYFKINICNVDEVFTVVEEPAYPEGGWQNYRKYLSKNLKYPLEAKNNKIEGRVGVEMVVDKKGELSEIKIIESLGFGCDEEAIRLIKNGPKWHPALQRKKPVKQRIKLPIYFKK